MKGGSAGHGRWLMAMVNRTRDSCIFRPMSAGPLCRGILFGALAGALTVPAPSTAQTKQPAVNQAALRKLAEPWPSPEELAARRVNAERRALFAGTDPIAMTVTAGFKT